MKIKTEEHSIICFIRRIRQYIHETLIHAFISSRLDCCNSLLYGSPSYQLKKLQRVQITAAGIIFQEAKYSHVMPLLVELHWLLVKMLYRF